MGQAGADLTLTRAARQARSVQAALAGRGISPPVREQVSAALACAMQPRSEMDDHHPAFLHPGRSALILLHDIADLPEEAITLAVLHESEDENLRPPGVCIEGVGGSEIGAVLADIPLPGDEDLTERLVLLPRPVALAALAEHLDQLRHLHLREDLQGRWRSAHEEVERAWLPVAERTDPRLTRRFAHWTRTFARRLRKMERGGPGRL